jgi:hypothetical protein
VAGAMCGITSSALTWLAQEGSIRRASDRGYHRPSDNSQAFIQNTWCHIAVIVALKQSNPGSRWMSNCGTSMRRWFHCERASVSRCLCVSPVSCWLCHNIPKIWVIGLLCSELAVLFMCSHNVLRDTSASHHVTGVWSGTLNCITAWLWAQLLWTKLVPYMTDGIPLWMEWLLQSSAVSFC